MNDGNVTVNYDPVGSGDGRTNFIEGGVSFAGSDSYLNDDEGELTGAKERCSGEDPIEVPAYVSPIAVAFNVEGVDALNLDADTIAQIFDGKITNWNDPAIADQNPDADAARTWRSRRSTAPTTRAPRRTSPTTSARPASAWSYEAEDAFPVKGGEAAEGTSGVISAVSGGKGTIGYADESQVGDLSVVSVKVGEEYVAPSAEGAAMVVETSPAAEGRADVDMAVDIDRTTTEAGAYPVVLPQLPHRLPDLRGPGRGRPRQGLPVLHRLRRGPGRPRREEAGSAPLSALGRRAGPGHRRGASRRADPPAGARRPAIQRRVRRVGSPARRTGA